MRTSADNLGDFFTLVEEDDCRHGANSEFLRNILHGVDVNLVELDLRVFVAEFFDLWRDGLTWSTPSCPAV